LENPHPFNGAILVETLGYVITELLFMLMCLAPFFGLSEAVVKPGKVVLTAPATGRYGGASLNVALAIGATLTAAR
jgi:hypothetical protein